jgi:alkylation response protein AidB-like acyl-CoA dehydrogenase
VFIFPIRQASIDVHRIEMLNGSKEFCQEFLTDLRVPDSDRIGDVDDGWTVGSRWMFHERMLGNSPLVTVPVGYGNGGMAASALIGVAARQTGRISDPSVRDLIGEARVLDIVDRELRSRIGKGLAKGSVAEQSAAIIRLFTGVSATRLKTIAFEIAGSAGAAWSDDDGQLAFSGDDYLIRQVSCIGGGTTEMARNVISERVLGMPRELSRDRDVPFRDVPRGGGG